MEIQSTPQSRTVFVATYCPVNTVDSFYVRSLADTISLFLTNNIKIIPILINDITSSVVAKNEILSVVSNNEYESVVFIDHNIAWDPHTLLDIVNSSYDAVAIPVVRKVATNVIFDLDIGQSIERDSSGYIKVNYASTAMFKLSNKLVTALCDSSLSITNPSGNDVKNVFECSTQYGKFFNEGITLCNKIRDLSFDVWINPATTCANIASNVYAADFAAGLAASITPVASDAAQSIRALYE